MEKGLSIPLNGFKLLYSGGGRPVFMTFNSIEWIPNLPLSLGSSVPIILSIPLNGFVSISTPSTTIL